MSGVFLFTAFPIIPWVVAAVATWVTLVRMVSEHRVTSGDLDSAIRLRAMMRPGSRIEMDDAPLPIRLVAGERERFATLELRELVRDRVWWMSRLVAVTITAGACGSVTVGSLWGWSEPWWAPLSTGVLCGIGVLDLARVTKEQCLARVQEFNEALRRISSHSPCSQTMA